MQFCTQAACVRLSLAHLQCTRTHRSKLIKIVQVSPARSLHFREKIGSHSRTCRVASVIPDHPALPTNKKRPSHDRLQPISYSGATIGAYTGTCTGITSTRGCTRRLSSVGD